MNKQQLIEKIINDIYDFLINEKSMNLELQEDWDEGVESFNNLLYALSEAIYILKKSKNMTGNIKYKNKVDNFFDVINKTIINWVIKQNNNQLLKKYKNGYNILNLFIKYYDIL